jgi:hypothetical protein
MSTSFCLASCKISSKALKESNLRSSSLSQTPWKTPAGYQVQLLLQGGVCHMCRVPALPEARLKVAVNCHTRWLSVDTSIRNRDSSAIISP